MIKITTQIKTLEQKQRDLIANLSEDELEVYINRLCENYFSSYLNNDRALYLQTVDELREVNNIFEFDFPNLHSYINSKLVGSINKLLEDNLHNDFKLVNVHEVTLKDLTNNNKWRELAKAYATGRENYKERQKERERLQELEQENKRLKELLDNDN